jgi:hypothetical protein
LDVNWRQTGDGSLHRKELRYIEFHGGEMIILKSIFTALKAAGTVAKISKMEPPLANLACLNL